jgi:hypothetical protein
MIVNEPYTYYLEWSTGMKYYGVRYSKDCHPSDLFVSYFTSSDYVIDYIKDYGLPNTIEVRNTFTSENRINEAIQWEKRVLDRLNAAQRDDYLNKCNSKGINYSDSAVSEKRNTNMKIAINLPSAKEKRKITESLPETKEKRSISALKREADPIKRNNRLSKAFSQEAMNKRKESFSKTAKLPEFIEKRKKLSSEINKRPEVIKANSEKNSGLNNARAIKEIFTFRNKVTGEIKHSTCYEITQFLRTRGIKFAHASNLVRKQTKSLAGWELVLNYDGI